MMEFRKEDGSRLLMVLFRSGFNWEVRVRDVVCRKSSYTWSDMGHVLGNS